MNWPADIQHQLALDRHQRLLGEAAAARLVGGSSTPARTRILRLLKRSTVGRAAAHHPCPPVGAPLTERR